MDKLILGLLILRGLTVYEIRGFLRQGMYLMYSDSLGSIQAAIKKLTKDKYVVFEEYVEKGKNKKKYSITPEGRESFFAWLSEPILSVSQASRSLTKLFFMGMLPAEERILIIQSQINMLQDKFDTLLSTFHAAQKVQIGEDLKNIAFYQKETIQLSLDSVRFEIDWYKALLHRVTTQEDLV